MSFQIRADGIMDPEAKYPNPLTGQPYSKAYRYLAMEKRKADGKQDGWVQFATWRDRIDIIKKIHKSNILLVKIPPGTGKTVIIPKLLLHYFGYQRPVLCTGPKQITVQSSAEYAAKCLDVPYNVMDDKGDEIKPAENNYLPIPTKYRFVGYKHGGQKNMANSSTKLLFTTDGSVKETILRNDANLSKYGGVIVDEVHERSVNIDIVIALLMDIVKRRPDFKVIFLSATMDLDLFQEYLKRINLGNAYSIYTLPDTEVVAPFKRTIINDTKKIDSMQIVENVYKKINEIILNPQLPIGNILAFVTSDPETNKIEKKIFKNMKNYPIHNKPYPIAFSRITPQPKQDLATKKNTLKTIAPTAEAPQGFSRKVIIGTNVVESGITFDDSIIYVIETGLSFEKVYDPKNYCYNYSKTDITKASIEQRCGRTGRTSNGTCYQLYRKSDFDKFNDFTPPKILQEDISKDFLNIIVMPMNGNVQKGLEFISRMIEPPKNYQHSIYRAYNNLLNMDFIDAAGNFTNLGRICNSFNIFDLKIAKMIVGSFYLRCTHLAIPLGAILQTVQGFDDIFNKPPGMEDDPALEKQYIDNIKRLKDDRGDHITLLRLYYFWINSPEPNEFAEKKGLNIKTLNNIQKTENDLMKEVEKATPYIKSLNLFLGEQTGGGNAYNYNISNFRPYRFDGEVDYEDDDDDDYEYKDKKIGGGDNNGGDDGDEKKEDYTLFGGTDSSDDSSDDELYFKDVSEEEINRELFKMNGGLSALSVLDDAVDNNRKNSNLLLKELEHKGGFITDDAINNTTFFQNANTNTNLSNNIGINVGGMVSNDFRLFGNDSTELQKGGRMQTHKNNTRTNRTRTNNNTKTIKSSLSFDNNYNGGARDEKEEKAKLDKAKLEKEKAKLEKEKVEKAKLEKARLEKEKEQYEAMRKTIERNKKIMEVITLKGLQPKN